SLSFSALALDLRYRNPTFLESARHEVGGRAEPSADAFNRRSGALRELIVGEVMQERSFRARAGFFEQTGFKLRELIAAAIGDLDQPRPARLATQGQHGAKYFSDGRHVILRDPESQGQKLGGKDRLRIEDSQ